MPTMLTPAGETIEVVSDEDFMEVYEVNPIDLRIWSPKEPILAALWHEGTCSSKSGRAGAQLHLTAGRYGYKAAQSGMNGILNGAALSGAIERKINGKRTNEIKLVRLPESYVAKLKAVPSKVKVTKLPQTRAAATTEGDLVLDIDSLDMSDRMAAPEPVNPLWLPIPEGDPPTPVPGTEGQDRESYVPEVGEDVAVAVARELLAEVVRIINAPPPEPPKLEPSADLIDARARLSQSLEYTQKLRRELSETGDELKAVKLERDALRQRLHIAEANMDKALGDGRRFVDAEVQKALGRIMSAKPTSSKGDDDA